MYASVSRHTLVFLGYMDPFVAVLLYIRGCVPFLKINTFAILSIALLSLCQETPDFQERLWSLFIKLFCMLKLKVSIFYLISFMDMYFCQATNIIIITYRCDFLNI